MSFRKQNDPWVLIPAVILFVVFVIAISLAGCLVLAWLVTLTASGFGHDLPYWPTAGACIILGVLISAIRGK